MQTSREVDDSEGENSPLVCKLKIPTPRISSLTKRINFRDVPFGKPVTRLHSFTNKGGGSAFISLVAAPVHNLSVSFNPNEFEIVSNGQYTVQVYHRLQKAFCFVD